MSGTEYLGHETPVTMTPHATVGDVFSELRAVGVLEVFLRDLGFVLITDICARNCRHCQAYGNTTRPKHIPFESLRSLLAHITRELRAHAQPRPSRTVHCWRLSDPLDYRDQTNGILRTCADAAELWRAHFGQGLYLVTNGSEGHRLSVDVLRRIAVEPELVSQVKLTVTPFDVAWGTPRYFEDIARDVDILNVLWQVPSDRYEDPTGLRFRVNVKFTPQTADAARDFMRRVLLHIGFSESQTGVILKDRRRIAFKPVYDLGNLTGGEGPKGAIKLGRHGERYKRGTPDRDPLQWGVTPTLDIFTVDMCAFRVERRLDDFGRPLKLHIEA